MFVLLVLTHLQAVMPYLMFHVIIFLIPRWSSRRWQNASSPKLQTKYMFAVGEMYTCGVIWSLFFPGSVHPQGAHLYNLFSSLSPKKRFLRFWQTRKPHPAGGGLLLVLLVNHFIQLQIFRIYIYIYQIQGMCFRCIGKTTNTKFSCAVAPKRLRT